MKKIAITLGAMVASFAAYSQQNYLALNPEIAHYNLPKDNSNNLHSIRFSETNHNVDDSQNSKNKSDNIYILSNSRSTWIGAQLFYNFDGSNLDNTVGAATIKLNTASNISKKHFELNVVGNIAKLSSAVDKDNLSRDLREISQSAQGLNIGLEPIFKIIDTTGCKFDIYGNIGYKINSFQDVNDDGDDVGLSQGRFMVGAQIEFLKFDDDSMLHLSVEGGASVFDKNEYAKVFGKPKSSLLFLETMVILPIGKKFGFLTKYTLTQYGTPVFGAGLVVRN